MATTPSLAVANYALSRGTTLVHAVLDWYAANKRDLPWRGADPYGVWVSEIMLQQTQVATVIPYYLRFMHRFPTVQALADAPLDDVLQHWSGLGYYARARNLHRAAEVVVDRFGGCVPDKHDDILRLPGIGRYTAGAILSIAYNKPYPAIDANVIRVVCRLFGIAGDPKSPPVQAVIREHVESLLPIDGAGEFNQALMELGALICNGSDPECRRCPLLRSCAAAHSANPLAFPEYAARKTPVAVTHACAVIANACGEVLIIRRPAEGLWGGLWEFPRVACEPEESPAAAAARAAKSVGGVDVDALMPFTAIKHTVMHYRITLNAFRGTACDPGTGPRTDGPHAWAPLERLGDYAFSSPQALVRAALMQREINGGL